MPYRDARPAVPSQFARNVQVGFLGLLFLLYRLVNAQLVVHLTHRFLLVPLALTAAHPMNSTTLQLSFASYAVPTFQTVFVVTTTVSAQVAQWVFTFQLAPTLQVMLELVRSVTFPCLDALHAGTM